MTQIKRSVEILAPVEEVFQFAADWQNWTKFYEAVSEFKPTTEHARGNGARFAYKAKLLGIKAPVETEITDFVENEGWTGVSVRGLEHKSQWIFAATNGATRFTYVLSYRLPLPVLGAVLDAIFMKPAWEKIIENSLKNLKRIMEEKTP